MSLRIHGFDYHIKCFARSASEKSPMPAVLSNRLISRSVHRWARGQCANGVPPRAPLGNLLGREPRVALGLSLTPLSELLRREFRASLRPFGALLGREGWTDFATGGDCVLRWRPW